MAPAVGGYFTSHVPAIGGAIQRGDQQYGGGNRGA
jgi:protocatechuate 4,5-dioxygenase beta chain